MSLTDLDLELVYEEGPCYPGTEIRAPGMSRLKGGPRPKNRAEVFEMNKSLPLPQEPCFKKGDELIPTWKPTIYGYHKPCTWVDLVPTRDDPEKRPFWADPSSTKGINYNRVQELPNGKTVDRTTCFKGPFYVLVKNAARENAIRRFDLDRRYATIPSEKEDEFLPVNPFQMTGFSGPGVLGRWGPNHAADPIVTRRTDAGDLEVLLITRKDNGALALPGGMVDPGEKASQTVKREFGEEVLNTLCASPEEAKELKALIDRAFEQAEHILDDYVDDPRNTDNAWIETSVYHVHGDVFNRVPLNPGDDAAAAGWYKIDEDLLGRLYASHGKFVRMAVERLN